MNRRLVIGLTLAIGLLAGCETQPPAPEVSDTLARPVAPPPRPVAEPRPAPSAALPASGGGLVIRRVSADSVAPNRRQPMAVKAITARADCSFRDGGGYAGKLALDVDQSEVKRLLATIDVPRHGRCTLALADFEQTKQAPSIELRAKRGGCFVRIWEQDHQATVAVSECRTFCTGGAQDYVWPIFVDKNNGRCG